MVLKEVAVTGLRKAINELTNVMKQTFAFSDNAQKASLALGMNLRETRGKLGTSIDGLRGSLDKRFMAGMLTLEAGLQGNSAGVAKLINQQQLTGGQYQGTAKAFAKLIKIGGVQADAANALAADMISTGNEFGVSTEVLVGALNSLESNMAAMNLAEMGPQVAGAMSELQSQLGPELAGPLKNVMGMVMDTSMEGYANLQKLGIGGVREQLAAATTTAEATQILKDAFVTASDNFKTVAGDAKSAYFQVGIASQTFGAQAKYTTTLANALTTGLRERNEADVDYADSLSTMISEVLDPLREVFMSLYDASLPTLIAVFKQLKDWVQQGVDKIKRLYVEMGGFENIIKTVKEKLHAAKDILAVIGGVILGGLIVALGLYTASLIASTIANTLFAISMIAGLLPPAAALATALWSFLAPILLAIIPIVALIGIFTLLYKKSETFRNAMSIVSDFIKGALIGTLKLMRNAIASTIGAMGNLIEGIAKWADILPGSDAMEAIGRGIQGVASKIRNMGEGGGGGEEGLSGAELDNAFQDQLDADAAALGIAKDSQGHLASIDAKTPDPTSSAFMDSTIIDLSRSIESILGVPGGEGDRDLLEDMVVTLGDIAESTGLTAENGAGGGAGFTPPE